MVKDLLVSGGTIMYVIILCSVVGVAFIIERFIAYWRAGTDPEFFTELENHLRLGKIDEARALCESEPGLVPQVLLVGLANHAEGVATVKQLLADEVQVHALPRLEKNLSLLGVVAKISPMLGLLGTVWGMIVMFNQIAQKPQFDITDIAQGIYLALGTTLAGLMVAIPVIFFHNHFQGRIRAFEGELYQHLTRFLRLLASRQEVAGGKGAK